MYACEFSVAQMRHFSCLHIRQDQNDLHLKWWFFFGKIGIFCKSIAGPLSEVKSPLMVHWLQLRRHTKVFIAKFASMMSPKCSIVENDGELMLMALHKHFLPHQQYSRWYSLFLASITDVMPVSFIFFHKIMNIRGWRCFPSSKIQFCNITKIFKVISQYFPALFKRIHNHVR